MKFPYGIADFYSIRQEGYFYQDRTHYIPVIEERGKQLVFLRPRRFGKSVWLSVLANYYDVARASDFEMLFGNLAIGQNPTPLHNQYFILRWDFSKIAAAGNVEQVAEALFDHINDRIQDFGIRYANWIQHPIHIHPTNAISSFESLLSAIHGQPYKLYLLIDEYDNFTNEIAMGAARSDAERYDKLVTGDGILKTVFKNVKAALGEGRMDRVFVTGVSPMLLSDLTSGFNTASDISLERQMHDLCGFTLAEVTQLAQRVGLGAGFADPQIDEMIEMMRVFYDGYTFRPEAKGPLYNPTLSLYFLDAWQREGEPPSEMLDVNLAMDKNKLEYIASRPMGDHLIQQLLEDQPELGVRRVFSRFQLEDLLKPVQEIDHLASLLFYFGLATITGRTTKGKLHLQIPNLVTRGLYYEQLREMLLPDVLRRNEAQEVVEQVYSAGEMQPLCDFIQTRAYQAFSNRDYRHANELTVKAIFLSLLYNDVLYIVESEPELNRRYADLLMLLRPEQRTFPLFDILIEFKYIDLNASGLKAEEIRHKTSEELNALDAVKTAFTQANKALKAYRKTLIQKYGDLLTLRVYSVVSLGFERILWQEVKGRKK